MFNVGDTLLKLATESGFAGFFANGGWQNLVMIVIACVLLTSASSRASSRCCSSASRSAACLRTSATSPVWMRSTLS